MKTNVRIVILITVFMLLPINTLLYSVTAFAWGDNSGLEEMRPSYTLDEINKKADMFGNTPFFNTISNAEIGNEKSFVAAQEAAPDGYAIDPQGTWEGSDVDVENGDIYVIRLYVNNNNPNGFDAIAEDVKVAFSIPSTSGKQVQVNGFIESSNASPSEYWDCINFNSNKNFHLEYIYGSAILYNDGVSQGWVTLGDEIATEASKGGVLIGYNALDGCIPGGAAYKSYVTIQVKVVYDYDFTVKTTVRLAGEKEWRKSVDTQVGDKVEFQIEYTNTSDKQQADVAIKDALPPNLRYIAGSTKIKNANHPDGDSINEDYLTTDGLKIGNYGPGANVYLMLTAEVVDGDLVEGSNAIENIVWGSAGNTTIEDSIKINVQNNKKFYMIIAVYVVWGVICLIITAILIRKVVKRNKQHKL